MALCGSYLTSLGFIVWFTVRSVVASDPIGGKSELLPFSLAHKEWAIGSVRGEKVENVESEENKVLQIGSKLE